MVTLPDTPDTKSEGETPQNQSEEQVLQFGNWRDVYTGRGFPDLSGRPANDTPRVPYPLQNYLPPFVSPVASVELGYIMQGVKRTLPTIVQRTKTDVDEPDPRIFRIRDARCVASYTFHHSRTDDGAPKIEVPGYPPELLDAPYPRRLLEPTRKTYKDENAARSPSGYTFEPLFEAIRLIDPKFNMREIDLVADRSTLMKLTPDLLSSATNVPRESSCWRFDAEIVENTMFFTPYEDEDYPNNVECPRGDLVPRAMTSDSAGSNFRVLRYSLTAVGMGGLECLIRAEAQACTRRKEDFQTSPEGPAGLRSRALSNTVMQTPSGLKVAHTHAELEMVDQRRIIEFKPLFESSGKYLGDAHENTLLWIAQPTWVTIVRHQHDLINTNAQTHEITGLYEIWETERRDENKILLRVINEIKTAVNKSRGKKAAVIFDQKLGSAVLIFERTDNRSALPPGLKKEDFWRERPLSWSQIGAIIPSENVKSD